MITTLLDHRAAPADAVRETYLTRWSASETTFGEDKTTIAGAGNRTSGPVLRSGSPRLVIQEAWAWLTATQLARASAAAALRGEAARARALRRKDGAPVTADEESFTAVVRHAVRSMASTQVTATSSLDAIAAAAAPPPTPRCTPSICPDGSGTPGACRKHARNSCTPPRPRRPSPGNHRSPSSRPASASPPARTRTRQEGGAAPPSGAADRGTARHPAATRGFRACPPTPPRKQASSARTGHNHLNTPGNLKHLKSVVLGVSWRLWCQGGDGRHPIVET